MSEIPIELRNEGRKRSCALPPGARIISSFSRVHSSGQKVPEKRPAWVLKDVMRIDATGKRDHSSTKAVTTIHPTFCPVDMPRIYLPPVDPARSTLKPLNAMPAMMRTQRNRSTEIAEPSPISSRPIEVL